MPEVSLAPTACEGLIWRDILSQHSLSVLGGSRERQSEDQLSGERGGGGGGVGYITCWVPSLQDTELIHPQWSDGMYGMENECDIRKAYSKLLHVSFLPQTRELTWAFSRGYTNTHSYLIFKSRWFYFSLFLPMRTPNSLTTMVSVVELEFEAPSPVDPVGGQVPL